MKKTFLALTCLAVLLLMALVLSTGLGLAQSTSPVENARPTPTPDGLAPPRDFDPPSSPDTPPLPDLVVERIEVEPATPLIGDPAIIKVTIKNQGVLDVPVDNNFLSDLYIDPAVVPIQLGQNGVDPAWGCQYWWVPAGGSWTLTRTYTFTDVKVFVLYAQVDTDGHVGEANENNNVTGPVHIEVKARNKFVVQTHEEFQLGLASGLDISHPDGVMRQGIFEEPQTEPDVYYPDTRINDITGTMQGGQILTTTVNQVKPILTSNRDGLLFAAWEDGRNGGVFDRDVYFSRSFDRGDTWQANVRINDDVGEANQVSPHVFYDRASGRLFAAWQDERNGDFDIYFAYSDDDGATWSSNQKLNDDVGTANQMNPSIAVGEAKYGGGRAVYVVWQDQRNGNDDVYVVRSDDGGVTWGPNYFVHDDPHMTWQNEVAPAVAVDGRGNLFVCWEDWRDPIHPEIYVTWSLDEGQTFGLDVPVTVPGGQSYRVEPSMVVSTHIELEEQWDPVEQMTIYVPIETTAIHVVYQETEENNSDIYYAYAIINYSEPYFCPYPYDFCFEGPQKVNGFVIDSDYVLPPDTGPSWPIEPSWRGQPSISLVPDNSFWTGCHADSTVVYSRGVFIAWSDAQTFDEWRYEIHTRRVASPFGSPTTFETCEDFATGMLNDNAKLYAYRNVPWQYEIFQPAATRQRNPSIHSDKTGIYLAWDDDRWDKPLEPNSIRNRDIFFAAMGGCEGIYISQVLDPQAPSTWYVLSWWGATQHYGDLLMQTRFGDRIPPPMDDVAANGWTRWTGNPSSPYLGCSAGEGCYYDAPGRHIVGADGSDWPQSRYIQFKVIIRGCSRLTALSQIAIHYEGPILIYLPVIFKNESPAGR